MWAIWVQPLTWQIRPLGAAVPAGLGVLLVCAVAPILAYALVVRPGRGRPATLSVDRRHRRFVAPNSPYVSGYTAIMLMFLAGGLIVTERVPNGDRMRVSELAFAVPVSVVAVMLFVAAAAVLLFGNRPSVSLDATGLTVTGFIRRTTVRWSDLVPGGPLPYLRVGRLHVDPAFLTATIRHYVERPEHRPVIGTGTELARLRS